MSREMDRIRELAGWDLDAYEYRPASHDGCAYIDARRRVSERQPFEVSSAIVDQGLAGFRESFSSYAARPDLHAEMEGLEWSICVVDLRCLLAFQRRLCFSSALPDMSASVQRELDLVTLTFGPAKPVVAELIHDEARRHLVMRSRDPNLHFRFSSDASAPVTVHAGSPFFEVAQYRGRWFLRDGYHRAYALLRAGIFKLPAVVVQAKSIAELGADRPWFFPEEILFSSTPPLVTDFLDDALTIEYERPPLIRTLRVTLEETFASSMLSGEQS